MSHSPLNYIYVVPFMYFVLLLIFTQKQTKTIKKKDLKLVLSMQADLWKVQFPLCFINICFTGILTNKFSAE
jgi:hypothetical protein